MFVLEDHAAMMSMFFVSLNGYAMLLCGVETKGRDDPDSVLRAPARSLGGKQCRTIP
jgi:hypothetical protein